MIWRRPILAIILVCGVSVAIVVVLFLSANFDALRTRLTYRPHDAAPSNLGVASKDELDIPSIEVRAPLQSPTSADPDALLAALERGVVRLPGTAEPGGEGVTFVTGHSSNYVWAPGSYKSVFALLDKLHRGDPITIFFRGATYAYHVTSQRTVAPDDLSVLHASQEQRLLRLMTCWPVGTTAKRLIVEATLDSALPVIDVPTVDTSLAAGWIDRKSD